MFTIQALAADLAGVRLRYHTPTSLSGAVDLSPAISILDEARQQRLTVDAVLDRLAERLRPRLEDEAATAAAAATEPALVVPQGAVAQGHGGLKLGICCGIPVPGCVRVEHVADHGTYSTV